MADEVLETTSGNARSKELQQHVDPIVQDIRSAEPPINVCLPMDTKTVAGQDRKIVGSSGNAAAVKDGKPVAGPASNFFQATLQKMFHLDASDRSKSSWSTATSESDEDRRLGANDAQALTQRPRFQKLADGSHVHNLLPTRKVHHRMHSILRDFGLHVGGAVEGVPQRLREHDHGRPSIKPCNSETTLTDKYGSCHKVIGKGAFGIVRIAHKTEPKVPGEKLFAVKEFKRLGNESLKKYLKRLTAEFCISSSLHHTNVIDTLDLLQDTQGNYCEVMEYCAGGDLYSLIVASGGLHQDEADCFFGQLINGVKYLHDNGVAHRDLKPENLLLTEDGCLKITDFGNGECFRMAWETQAHLSRGVCGSEPYIAPEVFTQDSFDPRPVDVWACGIIYMGMLTGRHMWRAAKSPEDNNFRVFLEAKERGSSVREIRALGPTRCRIISKIIEPNPKVRMTVEQISQDPWLLSLNNCHGSGSSAAMHGSCSAVSGQVPVMAEREGSTVVHV